MIVRIATEGQYELTKSEGEAFNELDDHAVSACDVDDEDKFHAAFQELLAFVRSNGQAVPDDRLEPSDGILPPPDVSFEEAQAEFTGEGLIPG
ncbi:MAG: PspA-associated protein PspAA [Solirubrobacteraceae bacterium]